MRTHELANVTPADAAQSILRFQGENYSLTNYPMFVDIFNTPMDRRLMRAGRQVSKTVTMAADMVTTVALAPYTPVLYSNSSGAQTTSFSTSKLDPFLIHSPVIYHNLMKSKHVINNVYNKRFDNFSEIRLTYFSESADRARGTSAHHYYSDEVQDVLYDALIDAEECLSAAPHPRFTYAGTSKTMSSTLEFLWSLSTKKEWLIKCSGCGKWNIPSVENIHQKGFVCKKCLTPLDTFSGRWHPFCASDGPAPQYDGFHIPQIIMPWHCNDPVRWAALLKKKETYPEYKFLNEVMGLPLGEGDSPITKELLMGMCLPELKMEERRSPTNSTGAAYIVGGIDWGGSGMAGTSRTVLSIYAVYPDRELCTKIFGKIYGGGEPSKHVENIAHYLRAFGANTCYGDHGGGNFAMSQLARLVPNVRVVPVMYTEQSAPYKWDQHAGRFTVNRTTMIDSFLVDAKLGKVKAFCWEEFKQFADDILNVHEEVIGENLGKGRRAWRRYPSKPDDSLHAMVFGWFAARVVSGRLEFASST